MAILYLIRPNNGEVLFPSSSIPALTQIKQYQHQGKPESRLRVAMECKKPVVEYARTCKEENIKLARKAN